MTGRAVPQERQARVCSCGEHGFVPLTRGLVAFVSPRVVPLIADRLWNTLTSHTGRAYARTAQGRNGALLLHRLVADAKPSEHVDHRDGDGMNNLDENVRACAPMQNLQSRRKLTTRDGRVRLKGVYPNANGSGKWTAQICAAYGRRHLGTFPTAEEAARAYDAAALELHGEFALTNAMLGLLPAEAA